MNRPGITAIYAFEMARARRTLWQSLVAPVITTSLYFLVFGTAIGSRMTAMDGVDFGSFIVPGLIMLSVLTAIDHERQLWHFLSEVYRHDLRNALSTDHRRSRRPSPMSARR